MVKSTFHALDDVDVVLWLVEMGRWTSAEEHILRRAGRSKVTRVSWWPTRRIKLTGRSKSAF
jgi:GTPase Era involved in 16S rRNA processing